MSRIWVSTKEIRVFFFRFFIFFAFSRFIAFGFFFFGRDIKNERGEANEALRFFP